MGYFDNLPDSSPNAGAFDTLPDASPDTGAFDRLPNGTTQAQTQPSNTDSSILGAVKDTAKKVFSLDTLTSIGRGVGTLASIPVTFPIGGVVGGTEALGKGIGGSLAALLSGGSVSKAIDEAMFAGNQTNQEIQALPGQVFLGAPKIPNQRFDVMSYAPKSEVETPEQKVVNIVGLPFEKLAELNKAISEGDINEPPSAIRYALGALPESVIYTVGLGGLAKYGTKAITAPRMEAIRNKRLLSSEEIVKDPNASPEAKARAAATIKTEFNPEGFKLETPVTLGPSLSKSEERRRKKTQEVLDNINKLKNEQVSAGDLRQKSLNQESDPLVTIDSTEGNIERLDYNSKAMLRSRAKELGSVEEVAKVFSTDSPADVWARAYADKLYKPKEVVVGEQGKLEDLNLFGDEEEPNKPFAQKLNKEGALTEDEFKQLYDKGIIKPGDNMEAALKAGEPGSPKFKKDYINETADVKSMAPDEQRRWFNRNMGNEEPVPLDAKSIAAAESAVRKVEEFVSQNSTKNRNIQTLKDGGFTDEEISLLSDSDLERKARNIRGETKALTINEVQVEKMAEAEASLKAFMDKVGDKSIGEFTPEEIAEHDAILNKIAGIGVDELVEPVRMPEPVKNGAMTYDAYCNLLVNRKNSIAERVALAKQKGTFKPQPAAEKVASKQPVVENRRRQRTETISNEVEESPITRTKTRAEMIADYNKQLADEGLGEDIGYEESAPRELTGELSFEAAINDYKNSNLKSEILIRNKSDWDTHLPVFNAIKNRKVIISDERKTRELMSVAYRQMPKTIEEAIFWDKLTDVFENHVQGNIKNKRSAWSLKAISKAERDKIITPQEANLMRTIFRTLKQQPDMKFIFDKRLSDVDAEGLYSFTKNLLLLDNPYKLAHEVGHWGFYNVLNEFDRAAWRKHIIENYYDSKGNLDVKKLSLDTTDKTNANVSASDLFACKIADFMYDKVLTKTELSLFGKVRAWWADLKTKLKVEGGALKFNGVEDIFNKIFDTTGKRRNWVEDEANPSGRPMNTSYAPGYGMAEYSIKIDNRVHPATYPKIVQKTMADIAKKLKIKEVLDIFGGVGKIGKLKEYGFNGKILANEIEPSWKGQDTISLMRSNGVDVPMIGDSRKLNLYDNSVESIFTSPTYGNLMGLKSPKKTDSYTAFAGGKLNEGNTGGEVWGPKYENLHKDIYKEAYRIIKPGGYFVLNMKDKPVSAANARDNWIPLKKSTVKVEDKIMKATDWHINELIKLGFKPIERTRIEEPTNNIGRQRFTRGLTVGYEDIVVLQKPKTLSNNSTLYSDPFGFQAVYNRVKMLTNIYKNANKITDGKRILAEVSGPDWGQAEANIKQVVTKQVETVLQKLGRNLVPRSPMDYTQGTVLERHVYNINLAEMLVNHKFDEHNITIDKMIGVLQNKELGLDWSPEKTKQSKANIRQIIEGKIIGTAEEREVAGLVRNWLDMMGDKHRAWLLDEYKKNLSKTEYNALLDGLAGANKDWIQAKYPKLAMDVIDEISENFHEIMHWGDANYLPNVEKGRFKILVNAETSDGKPYKKLVAIGLSRKDAVRKATKYLEDPANKDITELYVDTDFKVMADDKTAVSPRQYFSMMHDVAKTMKLDMTDIEKGVIDKLAQKVIGRKFKLTPTHTFDPYLLKDLGVLKGEEDIFPVLKSYAYTMEKKWALDPMIDLVRKDLPKMDKHEAGYILDLVEDVKGKYGIIDKKVDEIFNTYRGYSRLVSRTRTAEAWLKLGYRPIAAGVNLASGQMHAYVKRGTVVIGKAYQFLRTEEGKRFIKEVEPFLGTNIVDIGIDVKSETPLYHPLGMFQKAEPFNREVSTAAAYIQATTPVKEGGYGMTPDAAKQFAIQENWMEQFTYNTANLPKIMRGPTGKLLTQFKPYLIKEMEFISNLKGTEWARYLGMQLTLGGPRAYLMVVRTLPILAMFGFVQQACDWSEEWMNKNYPLASRGIAGLPGKINPAFAWDMSVAASFQFPSGVMDFLGPALNDIGKLYKNVLEPLMTVGPYAEDFKKTGEIAPIVRHWSRLMDYTFGQKDGDDWIKGPDGKSYLYKVESPAAFILQSLAGVENVDLNRISAEQRIEKRRAAVSQEIGTRLLSKAEDYVIEGKDIPEELIAQMNKNGVNIRTLVRNIYFHKMEPRTRAIIKAKLNQKALTAEMFPTGEDYDEQGIYKDTMPLENNQPILY